MFLKESLKKTKFDIIFLLAFTIIGSYLLSLVPLYTKYAIDGIIYNDLSTVPDYITNFFNNSISYNLLVICVFLILINFLYALSRYLRNVFMTRFNVKIVKNVKSIIINHTIDLEYNTFSKLDRNRIFQQINVDADNYINFFDTQLMLFLDTIFALFFALVNSAKISISIFIYLIICISILVISSLIFFSKNKKAVQRQIEANEKVIGLINDNLNNVKLVKMYNKQEIAKEKFLKCDEEYLNKSKQVYMQKTKYHSLAHVINITHYSVVITIGGLSIINHTMTFGDIVALLQYVSNALAKASDLCNKFTSISNFYIPYKRLNEYLKTKTNNYGSKQLLKGDIAFENVSIKINGSYLFKNLNLKLEEGKIYALVGDNGSGKSTILKVILGLYDYSGNIYIGDTNLQTLTSDQIINNFSTVLQSTFLFNGTIKDNIASNSNENIEDVVKLACLDNDIVNFANKLDTVINDNLNLSGGQKQRISIARAIAQNHNYFIFDDSFNKLDMLTKNKLLTNLKTLNKTMIIVTYDYNVINTVDEVLFVSGENIIVDKASNLQKDNTQYRELIDSSKNIIGDFDE